MNSKIKKINSAGRKEEMNLGNTFHGLEAEHRELEACWRSPEEKCHDDREQSSNDGERVEEGEGK